MMRQSVCLLLWTALPKHELKGLWSQYQFIHVVQQSNLTFPQSSTFCATIAWHQHYHLCNQVWKECNKSKTAAAAGWSFPLVVADAELSVQTAPGGCFLSCGAFLVLCIYLFACVGVRARVRAWVKQYPKHLEPFTHTVWSTCGCVCAHVHVCAQTLLDHLRASWWRDWAAARMGWLTGWLDGISSSSGS